jgi:hypothetical protein
MTKKEWKPPSLIVLDVKETFGPPWQACDWKPGDGKPPWSGGPGSPHDCVDS